VIVAYPGSPQATGGTIVTTGGMTYHTFTSSGTLTFFAVLPTVWQSFTAGTQDGAVTLDWSVSNDPNDIWYEVERSSDGSDFQTIASVPANSTDAPEQYSYTDDHPFSGKAWYRIEQIDADSLVDYSKTVSVETRRTTDEPAIQFSPNPVHDRLSVTLPPTITGQTFIHLYNASGAELFNGALSPGPNNIDMQSLPPGLYFVAIWENGQCRHVEKIVK
jgi:hypothetical protein